MRGLFKFLIFIVVIIVLAIIVLWVAKAPIVSGYLSSKLKTSVSIDSISLSKTNMRIGGFTIKNPSDRIKDAFVAKEIDVNYEWDKLRAEPTMIESIEISDSYLGIDCSNAICTQNNWTMIMSNIEGKKTKEKKEVIVQTLVLKNFDVEIVGLGLDPNSNKKLHFDQLVFNNISSEKGFPMQEVIFEIFSSAGIKEYLNDFLELTPNVENLIKPFKW